MEKLTNRQKFVLDNLKKFMANNGYAPTVRDLCKQTNLNSTATIQMHLNKLQEKGYIKKEGVKNRTIELLVPNEYSDKNDGVVKLAKAIQNNPNDFETIKSLWAELCINRGTSNETGLRRRRQEELH